MTDQELNEKILAAEVLYKSAVRFLEADIKRCEAGMRFYEEIIKQKTEAMKMTQTEFIAAATEYREKTAAEEAA